MRFFNYFLLLLVSVISHYTTGQPQTGDTVDSVFCDKNPNQSYALYLPSYYTPSKKWPAIFIFEPMARGVLPVKKFRSGAEELGYIIIASNNSKNGSWDLAFEAGDAMFLDAFSKYSIDTSRVYTSGFSGGSRVASAIAAITGKINGVIACGAGFASLRDYQLQANSPVLYAALVGDQDMNYQEHRHLADRLDSLQIVNNIITFHAGHQWPHSSYLTEALYWLELQCLKAGKTVSDNFILKQSYDLMKARADSTLSSGNLVLAVDVYHKIHHDFQDLIPSGAIKDSINRITETKVYKKQLKSSERVNKNELTYRTELGNAFTELYFTKLQVAENDAMKDMDWWRNRIDHFKKLSKKEDFQESQMGLRLINLVWARSAESSFNFINNKDYETALVLNRVWLYAEPNTWGRWNMAKILAYMDDLTFFGYLQEVVEANKSLSKATITTEKAFAHYLEHQQMRLILEQLQ